MKKLIIGACAVMALATVSCGKQAEQEEGPAVDKALSDSVSAAYGEYVGSYVLSDFSNFYPAIRTQQTKEDIIRGIQLVMGTEASEGMMMGMNLGLRMLSETQMFEKQGAEIDRAMLINHFKRAFLADSVAMSTVATRSQIFSDLLQQVQEIDALRQAKAHEGNIAAGEAYVAEQQAKDPSIKTTASGLAYRIEAPGDTTALIKPSDKVVLNYTGRHINGEVFDSSEGRGPLTGSADMFVTGFNEGLTLLGKGGKATLYIPGKLAYGIKGQPQAGIEPNEMLVFEIEVLDVNPKDK